MWSFGVLIWEIFNRKLPYPDVDNLTVALKVISKEITLSYPDAVQYPVYYEIMTKTFMYEAKGIMSVH